MSILIVQSSIDDAMRAQAIARSLVEERLAACVSVLPGLTSTYRWQGRIETATEALLLIKTSRAGFAALERRLRELHPYELPEIIAVDVCAAHTPYADWVLAQLDERGQP